MSKWGKIHDSWLSKAITEKSCKSWQELVDAFSLSFPDYRNPPNEDVLAFRWQVSNEWRRLGASIYKDPFPIDEITQPVTTPAQITNRARCTWSKEEDEWLLDITEKLFQAPDALAREERQKGWLRERSVNWEIVAAEYMVKFQSTRTIGGMKDRLLKLCSRATGHRKVISQESQRSGVEESDNDEKWQFGMVGDSGPREDRHGEKSNGRNGEQNEENEDDGDNYGSDYGENYEESDREDGGDE